MTTPVDPDASEPGTDASADELVADIERTREQLGNTVDALSQKFDVKGQARHKMKDLEQGAASRVAAARVGGGQVAARVKDTSAHEPKAAAAAALVVALIAVAVVVCRKRR